MRKLVFPLQALFASLLASTSALAGVYLESADSEPADKAAPKITRFWFDGGRMRSENLGEKGGGHIAIFKDRAMYTLDPASRSYRVIDKATAEQMGAKMADARKKMEAQMANMPPERRAMMERMMGQMGAAAPGAAAQAAKRTLKNTGRTETAAGVSCTVWEASINGNKEEELCAAKPGAIPGGDEVMKTFREIGEMMKGFTDTFARNAASQPWKDLETINGVPILTREFEDGKVTSETRLTVVRKESVPGAQFEVPAGYQQKKISLGESGDH